ncbi:MAG: hypothetical protein ACTSUK_01740 [Promethearchaeota archaeon]
MKNKAEFIIDTIKNNELNETEANILRKAVKKIKDRRKKRFEKSLSQASAIFAKWPEWKKNCL